MHWFSLSSALSGQKYWQWCSFFLSGSSVTCIIHFQALSTISAVKVKTKSVCVCVSVLCSLRFQGACVRPSWLGAEQAGGVARSLMLGILLYTGNLEGGSERNGMSGARYSWPCPCFCALHLYLLVPSCIVVCRFNVLCTLLELITSKRYTRVAQQLHIGKKILRHATHFMLSATALVRFPIIVLKKWCYVRFVSAIVLAIYGLLLIRMTTVVFMQYR